MISDSAATPWGVTVSLLEKRSSSWTPPSATDRERAAWRCSSGPVSTTGDGRSPALARVEAALFVADRGLSIGRLAKAALLADAKQARALVEELAEQLETSRSPFRVEKLASGYRLLTRPEYAFYLGKLHPKPSRVGLSPTALETLTIVAYRQPMTRADVDAIRGVQSLEVVKQLADRGLVRIVGEDDSLGRPYLYGTTPKFLEVFGLNKLEELPEYETLSQPAA